MNDIDLRHYALHQPDLSRPTPLYRSGTHAVYWLGVDADTLFRCNVYLIVDGEDGYVVDPGGRQGFPQILERVRQILPTEQIRGLIVCHQDPDVAASMVDWLDLHPDLAILTSLRTQALLPHYGKSGYRYLDIAEHHAFGLSSGARLHFIEAPFLHFPGAFATYDAAARFLFSGDLWAAIGAGWTLVSTDIESLTFKMEMFHTDYMASRKAIHGFTAKLEGLDIEAILPQHGSVIPRDQVPGAIDYVNNLWCGLDLLYLSADSD